MNTTMTRYTVEITTTKPNPDCPFLSTESTNTFDVLLPSPEYHAPDADRVVVRSMATDEVVYEWNR